MKKGIREKGQCHNITAHDRKVTWKIGLMAGQAAGLPPGIREGPYLESYIGEDKKHKEAGTLTTRWMTKRKT